MGDRIAGKQDGSIQVLKGPTVELKMVYLGWWIYGKQVYVYGCGWPSYLVLVIILSTMFHWYLIKQQGIWRHGTYFIRPAM